MKSPVYLLFSLLIISSAAAHSNILYDVSLDFDPELKEELTKKAQQYFDLEEPPRFFDYDRELITVKFDRKLEYSVTFHPATLALHGMRDDSKAKNTGSATPQERKQAAQNIFDTILPSYKKELTFDEEQELYQGVYKYTWYRYVNDVFVANDHLEVEVNTQGDVVAWRLSPFFEPTSQLKTEPAISKEVAQRIAKIKFNGKPLDFSPILVIYRTDPIWVTRIKTLYPIYVGVNALDGSILFTGGLRTELPKGYSVQKQPVPTEFIKEVSQ